MEQVNLDEAKERLLELIRAAHKGETVLITGGDQEAVQLVPVHVSKERRHFGSAKGLIKMAEDFDAPLEDFKDYIVSLCLVSASTTRPPLPPWPCTIGIHLTGC